MVLVILAGLWYWQWEYDVCLHCCAVRLFSCHRIFWSAEIFTATDNPLKKMRSL